VQRGMKKAFCEGMLKSGCARSDRCRYRNGISGLADEEYLQFKLFELLIRLRGRGWCYRGL
jgi:hypothetical protein